MQDYFLPFTTTLSMLFPHFGWHGKIKYTTQRGSSMRKWVIPLLLLLSLILPLRARAQASITFSSMFIEIWPEYDKPSVLVIYQITLDPATTLPAKIAIRIPTTAGDPNAVAERQADGSLITISNTSRQVDGDWATISFTTTSSKIQLEYYDPGLTKDGNARHFEYTWPGDYGISQLTLQVQQPLGATNMVISPSLGAGAAGTDKLIYYTQDVGAVSAGQTIQLTIDYQKSSDQLSAEVALAPSAPVPQSLTSVLNISAWLPWILGILGAGLIIGGIVWFWRTGRQRPARQTRRRRSKVDSIEPEADSSSEEDAIYCSQCGKRAAPGDQFCRSCGTAIRAR
jgi:hypothetical protein